MLKMTLFLTLLATIFFGCLAVVAAAPVFKSDLSEPELRRRVKKGDRNAKKMLRRVKSSQSLKVTVRLVEALLLVGVAVSLVGALGWLWGVFAALAAAVVYPGVARLSFVKNAAYRIFVSHEVAILRFTGKVGKAAAKTYGVAGSDTPTAVHSREELTELLTRSTQAVTAKERQMLASVLNFDDATARDVMTPRSRINSIRKDEFLGPLVLDELHSLGTSRLPVIDGDIHHVVGILNLRNLLSLDVKKSTTAEKAMDTAVYYVKQDTRLKRVLAMFLKTRNHLFIVTDDNSETVGIITLEDVIERLIGQSIMDEDDVAPLV